MNLYSITPVPFLFLIGLLFLNVARAQLEGDPTDLERALFEEKISGVEKTYNKSIANLTQQYINALESRSSELQEKGDLDRLLAVKNELTRFKESGSVPASTDESTPQVVSDLQEIYRKSQAAANQTRSSTILTYTEGYLNHLTGLQKRLTKDGKLDEAVKVRDEVNRVRSYKNKIESGMESQVAQSVEGDTPALKPTSDSLVVSWDGSSSNAMRGADGRPSLKYEFSHEGGNKLSDGVLHMNGGRTLVEGLNELLLDRCAASNEISVLLNFQTDDIKQGNHARIVSFSLDGMNRNFTLCQVNEELVLRLRTTSTGQNGTNPQVTLGKIKEGKAQKIVVTYRPGELRFIMDGESKEVQKIDGDFSNWEKYQLVLGNEWKDERPWKGRIHQFAIYSSVLALDQAAKLTK